MSLPPSILEDNDQSRARREHLEAIRALIGNAYPNKFARTNVTQTSEGEDTITSIVAAFKHHEPQAEEGAKPAPEQLEAANSELNKITVRVSGRLATPPRVMGKAAFVHLSDGKERLQIYVRRQDARAISNDTGQPVDDFESGWKLFQLLDHGDFIGVEGFLFVTKTGELSVHVNELMFLAKALLAMPDKLHGINDPEIRQRQRYADLIASSLKVEREPGELTTREVFERRSKVIREMRRYLDDHGYIEVETPMLSPIASGAAARPFETFHNALGIKLYARIAPELYLKRLLVGGFERVYELNRNFRNEGIGYRWNPEFTMLEFYCAYMDVNGMMDFCEEMLRTTIQNVIGGTIAHFGEHKLDFGRTFERLTMKQAIEEHWPKEWSTRIGIDFNIRWFESPSQVEFLSSWLGQWSLYLNYTYLPGYEPGDQKESTQFINANLDRLVKEFRDKAVQFQDVAEQERADLGDARTAQQIAEIFEKIAEQHLIQPTFITDFPKPISPLSKASPQDSSIAERFELFCMGMEIANGFSELNDPVEQYERFREQTKQRERGDEEAMQMDEDYVRALAYGMPPAAGIGIGIDRLTMLLTNKRTIREVILFPHMRPRATVEEASESDEETKADS